MTMRFNPEDYIDRFVLFANDPEFGEFGSILTSITEDYQYVDISGNIWKNMFPISPLGVLPSGWLPTLDDFKIWYSEADNKIYTKYPQYLTAEEAYAWFKLSTAFLLKSSTN